MLGLTIATALLAAFAPWPVAHSAAVKEDKHRLVPRAGQQLVAVWTTRDLITADLGGGTQVTHGAGLNIFNDAGEHVWGEAYPLDYVPCISGTRQFSVGGGCMGFGGYKLFCEGDFSGQPQTCEIRDWADGTIASGEGDDDVVFFAIGSGQEGYCAATWTLPEGYHCGEEEDLQVFDREDGV